MEREKKKYLNSPKVGIGDIPFIEKDSYFPDAAKSMELGLLLQNQAAIKSLAEQMSLMMRELRDLKVYVAQLPSMRPEPEVMVDKVRAAEILSLSASCFEKYLYDVDEHLKIPCHHLDGKNLFYKQELIQWAILYDARKRGLA
jgi:hypothetical protein